MPWPVSSRSLGLSRVFNASIGLANGGGRVKTDMIRVRQHETVVPILLLGLGLIFLPSPAFAYIDPGTGGMLLQLLLGGVAGAVVILKLYWRRLLSILGIGRDSDRVKKSEVEENLR